MTLWFLPEKKKIFLGFMNTFTWNDMGECIINLEEGHDGLTTLFLGSYIHYCKKPSKYTCL